MSNAILDAVKQYVSLYNAARQEDNTDKAVQVGRKLVELTKSELAKPNLPVGQREYYSSVCRAVEEYLADMTSGMHLRVASVGAQETSEPQRDWFDAEIPDLTLNDVAGLADVREAFTVNVLAPMSERYNEAYKKYRGIPNGVNILFYGPPGTGKTHVVKCFAGTLKCKIAVVQIKDVMANLVGDGARIISEIFEQASQYDKCIIFFDEIDAIAASRDDEDSRYTKDLLTTLLTCLDGFSKKSKPGQIRIVVAATNRPWALDSAISRRFDTKIYVPLPDKDARRKLVSVALGKDVSVKDRVDVPCAADVTVDWMIEKTEGLSGADIKTVVRQAVNRPLMREIKSIGQGKKIDDCVTREDVEVVLDGYITATTDESLMEYDAYRLNMEYGEEYVQFKCDWIIRALYNEKPVEPYMIRWFKKLYRNGYISAKFSKMYDLSFLSKILQD